MSDQFAAIFRRRPNDGWFRAGRYDVTTTDILCALAVASMFLWGLFRDAWDRLWFAPVLVRDFEVWRLVTWPIATEPAIFPLLGIVFFWLFGQQLESLFGRAKFVTWVLALTIVPAVILTVLGPLADSIDFMIQFGLSNLFLGGIWVYAATYPGVKWFEVIPLWALAAVFTVLNFLQFTGTDQTGQTIFLFVSIGVALVAGRSLGSRRGGRSPTSRSTAWELASPEEEGEAVTVDRSVEVRRRRAGPVEERPGADAAAECALPRRPDRTRCTARQDRRQRHGLAERRREEAPQRPEQAPPQPLTPAGPPDERSDRIRAISLIATDVIRVPMSEATAYAPSRSSQPT
jgi:hypothetical protein